MGDRCARNEERRLCLRRLDWSLVVLGHLLVRWLGENCRRIETCIDESEHRVTEAHSPNTLVNLIQTNGVAREAVEMSRSFSLLTSSAFMLPYLLSQY